MTYWTTPRLSGSGGGREAERTRAVEAEIGGFSTFALLSVAEDRGVITAEERRRFTARLIEWRHTYVPVDASLLYEPLAEQAFQIDGRVLRLIDVLADPSTTAESAVRVAVGVLRELALSSLGKGSLAAMTTLVLERLCANHSATEVVPLFVSELGPAFRLLPFDERIVKERLTSFLAARRMTEG
jgi:hypothetical protein